MVDCIFCKIVKGDIPAHKAYEDERTLAFLDIHPMTKGHALVIPKTHARLLQDLDAEDASALFETTYYLVDALQAVVDAPAATVAVNNGKEAGQEVPHVHIHIIPRREADGAGPIQSVFRAPPRATPEELAALAKEIRESFEE